MSKDLYIGVDSLAKKVSSMYIGVDGVARKVTKGYIGVDGVAQLFYSASSRCQINLLGEIGTKVGIIVDGVRYVSESTLEFDKPVEITIEHDKILSNILLPIPSHHYNVKGTYYHYDEDYTFTALPGHIYTINIGDSVELNIETTDEWNGVIFTSKYCNIPSVPVCRMYGTPVTTRGYIYSSYEGYIWLQEYAIKDASDPAQVRYGSVDVTNFKNLYFETAAACVNWYEWADNKNSVYTTTESSKAYRLYIISKETGQTLKSFVDEDGEPINVDLSDISGEIYIVVDNYYSSVNVAIKEMILS